jgi:hypothetical protein
MLITIYLGSQNSYFDHMNVSAPVHMPCGPRSLLAPTQLQCNLLDRNFHTPSLVCSRSPFLLTTGASPALQ